MEIQYYGANCLKIVTKKMEIISDPQSDIAEIAPNLKKTNILLITQQQFSASTLEETFLISGPGEYEFSDCSIKGIAMQPFSGAEGDKSATSYRINSADMSLVVIGHINGKLTEEQLEEIGLIDVVVVPIGGSGYTLDAVGAANLVRSLEPKLVIPVHSLDDGLKYQVPQQPLELFIKELGAVAEEPTEKLKLKILPEQLTIQPLKRQ